MTDIATENRTCNDLKLIITRIFDAPRELVWKAWTETDLLERWICPRDFKVTFCQGDLRPGGTWRTGMRSPDDMEHICGGEYQEIVPQFKLVFTHAWEDENGKLGHRTVVTVTFFDENEKTRMRFEQTGFDSVETRDGHEDGWAGAFDNLTTDFGKKKNG
ncbi:MAG: SRPBCC domain-containing protein [Desulforhopalus sp.]